MMTDRETYELGRIEKRAIEAQAVIPVIEAVAQQLGRDKAMAILQAVNEKEAYERGQAMREILVQTGIAELAADVATWGIGGEMELEILEQTETTLAFNVTRCPYYEKYRELGLEAYGVAFSCCRDKPFARGFHPDLKLARSQTIMEGGAYCDFRYTLH